MPTSSQIANDVVKIWSFPKKAWLAPMQKGYAASSHHAGSFSKPEAAQIVRERTARGEKVAVVDRNQKHPPGQ